MATCKPSDDEIERKRQSLKHCCSSLAKRLKATELELRKAENQERLYELNESLNVVRKNYEEEIIDIDLYFTESECAEMRSTFDKNMGLLQDSLQEINKRTQNILKSTNSASSSVKSKSTKLSKKSLSVKRAKLKLEQIEKRQELERKKQELSFQQSEVERRLEVMTLKDEIAMSEVNDSEDETTSEYDTGNDLPNESMGCHAKVEAYVRGLPETVDRRPSDGNEPTDMCAVFKTITESINENLNLPKPELLYFSGDSMEYSKFIHNFQTNIEARVSDKRLCLSYLIQYCQGAAKRAIDACVILPPDEGYRRAKQILHETYGKPHLIARSYVDRLVNGNPIKSNDVHSLTNLSIEMEKCHITLSQIGFESDINNTENLKKIVRRLPVHIRSKWVEKASTIIEAGLEPTFTDLLKFIQARVRVANTMYGLDLASDNKSNSHVLKQGSKPPKQTSIRHPKDKHITLSTTGSPAAAAATAAAAAGNQSDRKARKLACIYCNGPHRLINCTTFKSPETPVKQRLEVVRNRGMCENCMMFNHDVSVCRKDSYCNVSGCREKHNSLLHGASQSNVDKLVSAGNNNCCAATDDTLSNAKVSLRIVPVSVKNGKYEVMTYALLDEGSDVTLCSQSLVDKLNMTGKRRDFVLTTVNQSVERKTGVELTLQVSSLDGNDVIKLNRVWSVEKLPISLSSLPDERDIGKWKHLSGIEIPRIKNAQVELLIGSDTPDVFWVQDERRGKSGEPYAIKSLLGWSVLGPVGKNASSSHVQVNFQQRSDTQVEISRLWEADFPECRSDNNTGMSQDDRVALSMMEESIEIDEGHYKLGLPWRDKNVHLQNNRSLASTRLSYLKRKFERDEVLYQRYKDTMNDYIEKGYATEVSKPGEHVPGKLSYIPHHPVINPNKPGKVRIVFDCAARYKGESLNDKLLQGPDLTNSIVGVLIRFRQEPVALVADIESMFHQVKVSESDRDALRFLWWPGGDITKEPVEYRMNVHLFGATSSPSCAAYSLRRTGNDNADHFSEDVVTSIERNFYVDDLLKSVCDDDTGIRVSSELRDILSRGGFRLTKWVSNSDTVMETIPESERAATSKEVRIENDPQLERALGLQWYVQTDKFAFDVNLKEGCHTRRGILSVASSLYDPLGMVAPVTLIPKLVLQNACRQKLQWDDMIPENDAKKWDQWLQTLPELSKVSIDRCMKPSQLDNSTSVLELHMFSDASELSYASAVYAKIYDVNGNSKCSLVIGKSRLAPIKTVSIPRLELSAAVLSVKLYQLVVEQLDLEVKRRYFWTDSMIVLGYINNGSKRFKTFVANRIAVIHDVTSPDDWRYVPTKLNPADIGSRGLYPNETKTLEIWLNGPSFLCEDSSEWPTAPNTRTLDVNDVELKTVLSAQVSDGKYTTCLENLLKRYSDWYKLQRAVGWLLRFKSYFLQKHKSKGKSEHIREQNHDLTVTELRNATKAILMLVQEETFSADIKQIKGSGRCQQVSSLLKLSPIYTENLLRVGGRLENATINHDSKHPIILPSDHHVTRMIIRYLHNTNAHAGAHQTLSMSRQKYWIINGLRSVKSVLNDCMNCRRRLQRPLSQKMGNLPAERVTADKPPFTYTGIDYFGPMYVKSGRQQPKRYGCLFTCLTTRAVHIEIAHSLDTDSFICALQRFVSRRGNPEVIYSDNGTNLKAGEKELRDSINSWNQSKISNHLNQREVVWHFIPPHAPSQGGIWERIVRSVKTAIKSVIKEQLLNDEALLTLCTEVEKILNDRPITQISDDPRDPEPLTPSKLLLLRNNSCLPPGEFDKHDNYSQRRWRQVMYLANLFWRRWTREYLPSLQVRQKWHNVHRNIAIHDLVLVCDETASRGQWPLGRVLDVKTGRDGLVRSCRVKVNGTEKVRPISKLCLLEQHVD